MALHTPGFLALTALLIMLKFPRHERIHPTLLAQGRILCLGINIIPYSNKVAEWQCPHMSYGPGVTGSLEL